MEYLDFELPIKELHDQLNKCKLIGKESNIDVNETCGQIEKKLKKTKEEIYANLSKLKKSMIVKKLSKLKSNTAIL